MDAPPTGDASRGAVPHFFAVSAVVAFVALEACIELPLWTRHTPLATVNLAISVTYIVTGLMLYPDRSQRSVAWALMLVGALRPADWLDWWGVGPFPFYVTVFNRVDRVFGAWALLRYPRDRMTVRQRVYITILAVWCTAGPLFVALTSDAQSNGYARSAWWLTVFMDPGLSGAADDVVNAGEVLLAAVLVGLLVVRLVRTRGVTRSLILPIVVAALLAVVAASGAAVAQTLSDAGRISDGAADGVYLIEGLIELGVPLAFFVSAVLHRIQQGEIAQIDTRAGPLTVLQALRRRLGDPRIDILIALANGQYQSVDPSGPTHARPETSDDRLVQFIRMDDGTPMVFVADPGLARYEKLLDTAQTTSRQAVEWAQQQARYERERLDEQRAATLRAGEAAFAERARLERDLHDGAQQRIVALKLHLAEAERHAGDAETAVLLHQTVVELQRILEELRRLAHGILPATLSQGGIGAALQEDAEGLPLRVELTFPPGRFDPAVEYTTYLVVREALTNVIKHAEAGHVWIHAEHDDTMLVTRVSDDGIGGAAPDGRGRGLTDLAARVHALGGDVTIDSPRGEGTTIIVRVPCA